MKIQPSTTDKGAIEIGPKGTSFGRSVYLANPSDRHYTRHRFVLWFGAYGWTRVMVWADSLDDAIEVAGEFLAKHAPGLIMPAWGDEHKSLIAEVCSEKGIDFPAGFEALEDEALNAITDEAETDLTYTESGYLTSHEWGVALEDPTRSELDAFLYPPDLDWTRERGEVR